MSGFWGRTISRWVTSGMIGVALFGVPLVLELVRDSDDTSDGMLWLYVTGTALSLIALGLGVYKTRQMRSADPGHS